MITAQYYWKRISEDGLMKPVKIDEYTILGQYGYDSEISAKKDFCEIFRGRRVFAEDIILVKCYGMTI